MSLKCVDVSSWNGEIDWNKVRETGVKHAVLKVIRRDFEPDNQFENNWNGCQLAGVHICGVYNYVYTSTVEMAITAANRVLEVLAGRKVTVWMDIEDICMQNLGAELIDIIKAYKHVIEEAGYEFGIYTGLAWYGSYIAPYADKEILDCSFWIARYWLGYEQMQLDDEPNQDKRPDIVTNLAGWQYTSSGIVDGINGVVDLSEFYLHAENEQDNDREETNESELEEDTDHDKAVHVTYAAYTDRWWPEVTDREDWAGKCDNVGIRGLAIRVSRGSVKYRVHLKNGDWLPYVEGYDLGDEKYGYAGNLKDEIDAVEIIYYTPEEEAEARQWKYMHYMVSIFNNRNFYPEQIDDSTDNNMDGYAGDKKNVIDKIQMWVE